MAASASTPAMALGVSSAALRCRTTSRLPLLVGSSEQLPSSAARPRPRRSFQSLVAFSRRRKSSSGLAKTKEGPPRRKSTEQNNDWAGDDIDEDAFEALFSQLEEDLKNDNLLSDDVDDDISEEDLARLELELEEALGVGDNDDISGISPSSGHLGSDEDDEYEDRRPKLKNWQMRRLARALKIGRRKTSIKSLAAELGLERAFVLGFLRDPPPNLLLMSASLPDEIKQTSEPSSESLMGDTTHTPEPESKLLESPPAIATDDVQSKPAKELPVHVMRTRWLAQKRLKKVHIETLERVYSRTKRPTNAMISSIVHVTNLPWKRVLKWFEEKRLEDGIPDHRAPYRRSSPGTISAG
ncbi:protein OVEREXPRESSOR OF CATIONIC PEROXIDASE 3-like [Musa acuminata AAA Group]|uniref:protein OVEREXPRESSOR OF CATIONIC PEROXIDASE 3-like n=1 Tax=Musa acuminata AAA Group TaxID=214697 RepID=UPI0031CFCA1D